MNILLTGATGFLGSNLLKSLINNNHTISILVRSKSVLNRISKVHSKINIHDINQINFHNVICENKIDGIIHCATNYGRGNIKSYEILESNLIMPLQLIQAAVDCRVKFFINTDTILDKGISEYALSKYQFRENSLCKYCT
jgi:nucleoside-diphosphate-sugar epimerase